MTALGVGIIGCGNIAPVYFEAGQRFETLSIVACADMDRARAEAAAETHGVARVLAPDELVTDPQVGLVLILTPPASHGFLLSAAVAAGKHAYTEKPLGLEVAKAKTVLETAASAGVAIGCAPDTVLGAGIQTARKLIDDGWIGRPVSATAFMQCPGHESWHPNPDFYYAPGGGPLFDMGPYYLSALVTLLGPVGTAGAMAGKAVETRIIASEPRRGQSVPVSVPTHVAGVLQFTGGAIANLAMSFDVVGHTLPHLEIHGTEGSLCLPDPNTFGGPVRVMRRGAEGFTEVPLTHAYATQSRGLGVAEMVDAIRQGRPPRASGALGLHVLAAMEALHQSAATQTFVPVLPACDRPAPMPMNLLDGQV